MSANINSSVIAVSSLQSPNSTVASNPSANYGSVQKMAMALQKASPWDVKQLLNRRLPGIVAEVTGMRPPQLWAFSDVEKLAQMRVFIFNGKNHLPDIIRTLNKVAKGSSSNRYGLASVLGGSGQASLFLTKALQRVAALRLDSSYAPPRIDPTLSESQSRSLARATFSMIEDYRQKHGLAGRFINEVVSFSPRWQRVNDAQRELRMELRRADQTTNQSEGSAAALREKAIAALQAFTTYVTKGEHSLDAFRLLLLQEQYGLSQTAADDLMVPGTDFLRMLQASAVWSDRQNGSGALPDGFMIESPTDVEQALRVLIVRQGTEEERRGLLDLLFAD